VVPVGFLLVALRSGKGVISKYLKKSGFQFLGNISFELYMTHAFVYEGLPVIAGVLSSSLRQWLVFHAGTRFMVTFVLCIVFAWMVHVIVAWGYAYFAGHKIVHAK